MPETSRFDCRSCSLANNIDDMVECEGCGGWFHYGCVGFDDGMKQANWKCEGCVGNSVVVTTAPAVIDNPAVTSSSVVTTSAENPFPNVQPPSTVASSTAVQDPVAERTNIYLKLLEDQKSFMLREIELEHKRDYEQKKLLLEKEAWRVRCGILNVPCEDVSSNRGATGRMIPVSDWPDRSPQIASSTVSASIPVSSVAAPENVTPLVSSATQAMGIEAFLPALSGTSSQPIVPANANATSIGAHPIGPTSHPQSTVPTSSYLHDFLPGGGRSQPGSSTPITSSIPAPWNNPMTNHTNPTQSLPPSISSVRQVVQHPSPWANATVSQYNPLSGYGNPTPLGLGLGLVPQPPMSSAETGYLQPPMSSAGIDHPQYSMSSVGTGYSQYPMSSVGIGYPHWNQINANNPYVPAPFPHYFPLPPQIPTVSQSVPVINNCDLNAPTSRQLAARHVMPKDLPTFTGSSEEWPMFYSAFHTSTEACGFSEVENLGRLQRCLKGSALEAVRSRLLLPSSVPQVIRTLQQLYGRPEQIIYALLTKVREVPAPKADNLKTLVTFGMAVQNFCDHLVAAGQVTHLSNPVLLQELIDKLPAHLKLNWAVYKRQFPVVDLRAFGGFMADLVSAATDVTVTLETGGSKAVRGEKAKGFINAHSTAAVVTESVKTKPEQPKAENFSVRCLVCSDPDHRVKECEQFKKMNGEAKWKTVQTHQLCRICLGKHGRKPCRSQIRCEIQGCQVRHHPLLHSGSTTSTSATGASVSRSGAASGPKQSEGVNSHRDGQGTTLFRILPVTLFANGRRVDTFAFIDEGSSVTLVEEWIANALDVKGVKKRLCLSWTGNVTREEENSRQISVEVSGSDPDRRYMLEGVRTVSSLALPTQSLRYNELAERYQHLRELPITDYESVSPGLLIGAGHTPLTATKQLREGRTGEPIAAKTRLGWAVYGSLQDGILNRSYNLHVCECMMDIQLHDLVKQYFTVENVGVSADRGPESDEEKRARSILERTTRRVDGGFETGLLWRHDHVEFPDSYPMAVRRLQCFERRLKANPVIEESVRRQIVEYQEKGYIHEATPEELRSTDPRRVWYLPLSVVQNPKKPSKIRLVWDAAAKVDGISLNCMLLKGPDLVVPLPTVLHGFRERRVALGGDLMEMFHQAKIRAEDRNAQRFLMRDSPDQKPRIYIMNVATFGSTCSPCSAQYIKNRNAQEFADRFPRAAESIQRRHYVDDYLDSFDSEEEACRVAEEVRIVHKQGGFTIRNWLSNSSEVLQRVGATDGYREKAVDADKSGQTERVLGMLWIAESDVFVYANGTNLAEIVPTKRGILRCVMSQYDPLGLLSHFLIHGRVIIQDIWRTNAGWDDQVGEEIRERWQRWTGMFEKLKEVSIPRAYFPHILSGDIEDLQLHVFVDASETAYACVAYFRAKIRGEFQTALVGAKSKVSPLKSLSIPRLELQAAIIGCRLMKSLCASHSLPIVRRVFWTDSKTVLAWINSDHRRYRQFVACRIGEILSKSNAEEWRWIPTKENVADEATKWGKGPSLYPESRWFTGPEFLKGPETSWPLQPANKETPEELKQCMAHYILPQDELID